MKILYVGRQHPPGTTNDDEGAVTHALRVLGHEVTFVPEGDSKRAHALSADADFCLFNKWSDFGCIKWLECPRVLYYWDLVTYPDPTLAARNASRVAWMQAVIPHIDVGFLTDGDFVAADTTGKLFWLPQGADERVAGRGTPSTETDILFTGTAQGGRQRASFVETMFAHYGNRFRHVPAGVHGKELRDLIAGAKIVVAPDGPVTPSYCSNRAYLTLGFGGFLLHPYCQSLARHYRHGEGVVYYDHRAHLHELIQCYLGPLADERAPIAARGLARTLASCLYRHRCWDLIQTVKERLP